MNDEIKQIKIKNLDRLYEYRQELYKKPILRDLFLEVTSRCNARCEHCGSSCGDFIPKDEISADELKKALLDISKHYNANDILLNVTGGEPLVRKDLFEIMDYANKLGFRWGMTSNGMLINDEILKKMNDTNMETISISLDGLKETHESFRKVPGSFDKIIENIKKLQKVPSIKIVQVTTVANKKNLNELEDLYNLMKELNIISWRVINVDPIGRAKGNKDILLDKEEYKWLFNFIKEKREENIIQKEENKKQEVISKLLTKETKEVVDGKETSVSKTIKNLKMKHLPLDLRPKKTRAIRRKMTKFESKLLTLKLFKRKLSFPMRKFAVPCKC